MARCRRVGNRPCVCALLCSQAYYILDEVLIGGHLQDVNKREILRVCAAQDDLMEEAKEGPGPALTRS